MGAYNLLKIVSRFLFPFVILFGLYIIVNGDISPGGGFQGGVVLASSYIILYFINEKNSIDIGYIVKIEKILFVILIVFSLLKFLLIKNTFFIIFNFIIGIKVTLGLCGIIAMFIEEGNV